MAASSGNNNEEDLKSYKDFHNTVMSGSIDVLSIFDERFKDRPDILKLAEDSSSHEKPIVMKVIDPFCKYRDGTPRVSFEIVTVLVYTMAAGQVELKYPGGPTVDNIMKSIGIEIGRKYRSFNAAAQS